MCSVLGFCICIREEGWDGRLVNQSYEWVEQLVAFRPPIRGWQSAVRDGLLEAGVVPNNGFTYDHIYGTKVGGTIFYVEGHRHTAADLLEYADSTRLTVLLHATVHKILFRTRGLSSSFSSFPFVMNTSLVTKNVYYLIFTYFFWLKI